MTKTNFPRPARSGSSAGKAGGPLGRSVRLVLAGHKEGDKPTGPTVPALAVLGRSNVGKSSLLNSLLGTKVARVSQTPGRTQALYWYRVDEQFDVVDCPGYGYAKTAKGNRELFAAMIEAFLVGEPRPAAALLLIDGRLPAQDSDQSMALFLLQADIPTLVAVTKWDAVKPSERFRRLRDLSALYQTQERTLQPVSSETGEHLQDLARRLRKRLFQAGSEAPTVTTSAKEP